MPERKYHPSAANLMQYFVYDHLPPHLKDISRQITGLANDMFHFVPQGPEYTVGLRKLLEAKDCFVRARFEEGQEVEDPGPSLQFFAFEHLPPDLRTVSSLFNGVAQELCLMVPSTPEFFMGLRKLLEAKDCFVRAKLAKVPQEQNHVGSKTLAG